MPELLEVAVVGVIMAMSVGHIQCPVSERRVSSRKVGKFDRFDQADNAPSSRAPAGSPHVSSERHERRR